MKKNNKKPENSFFDNNGSKLILGFLLISTFAYLLWFNSGPGNDLHTFFGRSEQISFSDFNTALSNNAIKNLVVESNGSVSGTMMVADANGVTREAKFKANAP